MSEMIAGSVIIGSVNGSAFYPGSTEDSKLISKLKLFFTGSSISLTNVDQAHGNVVTVKRLL